MRIETKFKPGDEVTYITTGGLETGSISRLRIEAVLDADGRVSHKTEYYINMQFRSESIVFKDKKDLAEQFLN